MSSGIKQRQPLFEAQFRTSDRRDDHAPTFHRNTHPLIDTQIIGTLHLTVISTVATRLAAARRIKRWSSS